MKTAMQKHMVDLYKIIEIVKSKNYDEETKEMACGIIEGTIENAESFLREEKEQINIAYQNGASDALTDLSFRHEDTRNTDYYQQTYGGEE